MASPNDAFKYVSKNKFFQF